MPNLEFEAADDGKVVNVPVGRRFRIRLEENPTTGYRWAAPEFDGSCLGLEADSYAPHQGAAIGGGGVRQFEFAVKSECRTTIRLINRRSWETNAAPRATYELTVVGTP